MESVWSANTKMPSFEKEGKLIDNPAMKNAKV